MYYWTKQSPVQQQFDGVRILECSKTLTDMRRKFIRQFRAFGHKPTWDSWCGNVYVYKRSKFGVFDHHATYKVDVDAETFTKLRGLNF